MFIRSWSISIILHLGTGARYGVRLFRGGQKVSCRFRYGSEDSRDIDYVDSDHTNGFLGFLFFAVLLIIIAK